MKISLLLSILISFHLHAADLSGLIDGKLWNHLSGSVTNLSGKIDLNFWNSDQKDPCSYWAAMSDTSVTVRNISLDVGDYPLSETERRIAILTYPKNDFPHNLIVDNGLVTITEIKDNLLFGHLSAEYNSLNNVKGDFVLTICE